MTSDVTFEMRISRIVSPNTQVKRDTINGLNSEDLKIPAVRTALVYASFDPGVKDIVAPMLKEAV